MDTDLNWTRVLSEDALPPGARQVVKLGKSSILLLHHEDQIYAVERKCPHLGGPLEKGKVTEDGTIICPWHHSAFELHSGEVKAWSPWPPGAGRVLGTIRRKRVLRVFQTRLEEGGIWVAS